jgi:hypothetical protein
MATVMPVASPEIRYHIYAVCASQKWNDFVEFGKLDCQDNTVVRCLNQDPGLSTLAAMAKYYLSRAQRE